MKHIEIPRRNRTCSEQADSVIQTAWNWSQSNPSTVERRSNRVFTCIGAAIWSKSIFLLWWWLIKADLATLQDIWNNLGDNHTLDKGSLLEFMAPHTLYFYHLHAQLGVCIPSECSAEDIEKLVNVSKWGQRIERFSIDCEIRTAI